MKRSELRLRWVAIMQRSYLNKRDAARLYRALAAREPSEPHREILLFCAESAARGARHFEERLWHLGVFAPLTSDSPAGRVRRWLLVRCGKRCALRWLAWVERRDLHRLMSLVRLDRKRSGREWASGGRRRRCPAGAKARLDGRSLMSSRMSSKPRRLTATAPAREAL